MQLQVGGRGSCSGAGEGRSKVVLGEAWKGVVMTSGNLHVGTGLDKFR